jgi:ligand-binding sensor domain-containing protein
MKYIHLNALFLGFVFCTSCGGQNQTDVPEAYIKSEFKDTVTSYGPSRMVRNVKQAKNGDILIAAYNGVFRYDGKSFTNITSRIPSPSFWDVLEDRKGNLWFATRDSGVYLLPAGQTNFQHFTTKEGLSSNTWFGASRYDARLNDGVGQGKSLPTGQAGFRNFTTKDGYPSNSIRLLLEDKTGKLWFGAQQEDMFVYDGKTYTVLKNKDGKAFNNVWSIIEDKKGNIWFGATIIEDKRGDTSFVSQGLWRYDGSTYTKVSQRGAYAIIQDKKGNIWTSGEVKPYGDWALSRYDAKSLYNKKPTVTEIKSQSGMLLGILEDAKGDIWVGSGSGVYRYDGKTFTDFKDKEGQQ